MQSGHRYVSTQPSIEILVERAGSKRVINKKSELMLMRRARAHSNSCSQVILVHLYPFRRNSLFCSQKSPKNHLKINIFRVQDHLRSSMLTFLRSSSPVLVMISSMTVHICNHFHASRAYSGKITFFRGRRCPYFSPSFEGIPFTQRHEILSRNTRESTLSYGETPKSLSHLVLDWYRVVKDGQTDGQRELP